MQPYEPTARRPIAGIFRQTARGAVAICIRFRIHPDTVSYASLAFALGAALCFWKSGTHPVLLLVAPALCYGRLFCNMLDGMVAMESGKASRRGEIVNELPDRISDILIFAGVAHSGLCVPAFAYWAAILAVLTAYVGVLGQAVGARREFSGVMSKPWRMVWLHVGAWTTYFLARAGIAPVVGQFTVLDLTCLVVAVGCVLTVYVRLRRILRAMP